MSGTLIPRTDGTSVTIPLRNKGDTTPTVIYRNLPSDSRDVTSFSVSGLPIADPVNAPNRDPNGVYLKREHSTFNDAPAFEILTGNPVITYQIILNSVLSDMDKVYWMWQGYGLHITSPEMTREQALTTFPWDIPTANWTVVSPSRTEASTMKPVFAGPFVSINKKAVPVETLMANAPAQPLLTKVVGGASAAYSLRDLNYNVGKGYVVRIQVGEEAQDDEEGGDLGVTIGDFTAQDIEDGTMESFCNGRTAYVTIWFDQTGNRRHLYAAGFSKPIIARGGVLCDGIEFNLLKNANGTQLSSHMYLRRAYSQASLSLDNLTVTSVVKFDSTYNNFPCTIYGGGNSAGTTDAIGMQTTTMAAFRGNSGEEKYVSLNSGNAMPVNQNVIFTFTRSGSNARVWINGAPSNIFQASDTLDGAQISANNLSGNSFKGTMHELVVYASDQTQNREAIEANLSRKYGSTTFVPPVEEGDDDTGYDTPIVDEGDDGDSTPLEPYLTVSPPVISVNEGTTLTITVHAPNNSIGSSIHYSFNGFYDPDEGDDGGYVPTTNLITQNDLSVGQVKGTMTISSGNNATVSVVLSNDQITEQTEFVRASVIVTNSRGYHIMLTRTLRVNDSSRTPIVEEGDDDSGTYTPPPTPPADDSDDDSGTYTPPPTPPAEEGDDDTGTYTPPPTPPVYEGDDD